MPSVFRRRASGPANHDSASPEIVVAQTTVDRPSFRDRGRLRRRLAFLRRTRELAFRDIGGLMFDLRRFGRDRPDLVEAKLAALAAVDQELRTLERVLDDRRPLHELREPGITSCARCGALHASEANFCPHCGLQLAGPRAMGEVGGAIAAPPQPPVAPVAAAAAPAALTTATVDSAPTQPFDAIAASDAAAEPSAQAPDAATTAGEHPAVDAAEPSAQAPDAATTAGDHAAVDAAEPSAQAPDAATTAGDHAAEPAEPSAQAPDASTAQTIDPVDAQAVAPIPAPPGEEPAAGAAPTPDEADATAEPTDTTRPRHDDRA